MVTIIMLPQGFEIFPVSSPARAAGLHIYSSYGFIQKVEPGTSLDIKRILSLSASPLTVLCNSVLIYTEDIEKSSPLLIEVIKESIIYLLLSHLQEDFRRPSLSGRYATFALPAAALPDASRL